MPCPRQVPELGSVLTGGAQFAGTAAALFAGGDGEASLALFAFFFLFFFLVPNGAWSPLSPVDSLPCSPDAALLAVVATGARSVLSSLAFFFHFLFFFFAFFSTLPGPWMADSWTMSEADTAASRQRCNSSSPSSLLQRECRPGQLESGRGPKAASHCLSPSHQREATDRGWRLENSGLAVRQSWVPILASLLPGCVTSYCDLTSLTLSVFIYKTGILTEPRPHRDVPGVQCPAQDGCWKSSKHPKPTPSGNSSPSH